MTPPLTTTQDDPALYSEWVERVAAALHEDCTLEWQAVRAIDPNRQVTHHLADAHYGMAHDLVRRLNLAAQPAPPAEALRLLRKVLDEFDFWVSKPRPAIDGGTVRIHNFQEVQPNMERTLAEARRYLAATEEGT